jgi:acid phosphatase
MHKRARTAGVTVAISLLCLVSACGSDTTVGTTSTTTGSTTTSTTTSLATTSTLGVTTSQPDATAGDTIFVVGDWGTGTAPEGAVAGAMQRFAETDDVAAVLTTGDNFYSDDAEFIMHPYAWMEDEGAEWWITWGNHDVETPTRIDAVNETFDEPPRWTSLEWGDLSLVILDSTQVDSPEQADFLATTLSEGDDPTIVVFHHPPHSCESHAEQVDTQGAFGSMFDEDVFLVLSGHEHNYQRFEAEGVTYLITGGGGAGLTEFSECTVEGPAMIVGEVLHHFLVLTQNEAGGLAIQAVDVNGVVFDEFVLDLP